MIFNFIKFVDPGRQQTYVVTKNGSSNHLFESPECAFEFKHAQWILKCDSW